MQDDVKLHPGKTEKDIAEHNGIILHPDRDGIDHINFYTRARTPLGRAGSNLADTLIRHPIHGSFITLEGLWHYLKTGMNDDVFRACSGHDAKKIGKDMKKVWNPRFYKEFKLGILAKVEQHSDIRVMLANSTLPLVHYYYYGRKEVRAVIKPGNHTWQMEFWEELRGRLHAHLSFDAVRRALLENTQR